MTGKVRKIFWPMLEKQTAAELNEICQSEHDSIRSIQETGWDAELELVIEEARRLVSEEDERRKTAESKASNLLLVAAALIPLLTYLETAIWDSNFETAPNWLTLPMLSLAVVYLGKAGLWAFQTIGVGNYHRVYPEDLVRIWNAGQPIKTNLVIETLVAIRRNQETINTKVSASKMTHAFLLRAILAFSALLLVRIGFGFWYVLEPYVLNLIH